MENRTFYDKLEAEYGSEFVELFIQLTEDVMNKADSG